MRDLVIGEVREGPHLLRRLRRVMRSPKGILLLLFVPLLALGLMDAGTSVLPGLMAAVVAASVVDIVFFRIGQGKWIVPDGAILTALIVAMVLSSLDAWYIVSATAVLAVLSKHIVRVGAANVFNPAALAIVVASLSFDAVQDWWGALPAMGWWGIPVLLAIGLFIADRVNKMPLVLSFLLPYFSLFTLASIGGDGDVAEIFRAPDLHAVLFFALFMADDPPTSPVKYRHQVAFGVITAVASFAAFQLFGWVYFLPAALLVANGAEGARRLLAERKRAARRPAAAALARAALAKG